LQRGDKTDKLSVVCCALCLHVVFSGIFVKRAHACAPLSYIRDAGLKIRKGKKFFAQADGIDPHFRHACQIPLMMKITYDKNRWWQKNPITSNSGTCTQNFKKIGGLRNVFENFWLLVGGSWELTQNQVACKARVSPSSWVKKAERRKVLFELVPGLVRLKGRSKSAARVSARIS